MNSRRSFIGKVVAICVAPFVPIPTPKPDLVDGPVSAYIPSLGISYYSVSGWSKDLDKWPELIDGVPVIQQTYLL